MTTEEMISRFKKYADSMIATMIAKNHDYSAGADPFRNLRRHGCFGIVVRMGDKLARLETFTGLNVAGTPMKVKDESFRDTCLDMANYALLLALLYEEETEGK